MKQSELDIHRLAGVFDLSIAARLRLSDAQRIGRVLVFEKGLETDDPRVLAVGEIVKNERKEVNELDKEVDKMIKRVRRKK